MRKISRILVLTCVLMLTGMFSGSAFGDDGCKDCRFRIFPGGGIAVWCDAPRDGELGYTQCSLSCQPDPPTCYCDVGQSMCLYIVVWG